MVASTIKFKRSSTPGSIPTVNDIGLGELALNTHAGKLFTKKHDGITQSIVEIGGAQYSAGTGIQISPSNVISSVVTSTGPVGSVQLSNGTGGFNALPAGTVGQYLVTAAGGLEWQTKTGVTSVNGSGGTTGLTMTGGPITTAGTLTLGGVLGIANGGTGATTQNGLQNAALPQQGVGTANYVLTSNGTNAVWAPVAAGGVTSVNGSGGSTGLTFTGGPIISSGTLTLGGTLALANGGTGATTAAGALAAILPTQSGQNGYVLTSDGTSATWQPSTSGVTSVNASGGTTGLAFTGGPVTSSGVLTLTGVLGVANGGTGVTTTTALTTLVLPSQTGHATKFLQTNGTSVSWQPVVAVPGGTTTQVQFNQGGVLAGDAGLTYNALTLTATNVTVTGTSTLSTVNTNARVTGNVIDVAASEINTQLGNYFRKTATGTLTWTFINPPAASRSYIFSLRLQNGGVASQFWPSSVRWPGGTAPTLTASGFDLLLFETDNGGTSWRGAALLNYDA